MLTISNCTFVGNSANFGNALGCYSFNDLFPSTVVMTNCIIWDGGVEIWNEDDSAITVTYSDVFGGWAGDGNFDADPSFVDPTNNDCHLAADSLCIDAGDPNFSAGPDERDIDQHMRVWDGDADGDWRVDIGADEFDSIIPGDLDGDGCVGQPDLGILLSGWGGSGGDLDGDGQTGQPDLGILLAHWGEGC